MWNHSISDTHTTGFQTSTIPAAKADMSPEYALEYQISCYSDNVSLSSGMNRSQDSDRVFADEDLNNHGLVHRLDLSSCGPYLSNLEAMQNPKQYDSRSATKDIVLLRTLDRDPVVLRDVDALSVFQHESTKPFTAHTQTNLSNEAYHNNLSGCEWSHDDSSGPSWYKFSAADMQLGSQDLTLDHQLDALSEWRNICTDPIGNGQVSATEEVLRGATNTITTISR